MTSLKTILSAAIAALFMTLALPSLASADCGLSDNAGGLFGADTEFMPEESSAAVVRNAYANNACLITAGLHPSGSDCLPGRGNNHITVRVGNATYHVFDYTIGPNNRYCTTDRLNGPPINN